MSASSRFQRSTWAVIPNAWRASLVAAFLVVVAANVVFVLVGTRSHPWLAVIPPMSALLVPCLAIYLMRRYGDRRRDPVSATQDGV